VVRPSQVGLERYPAGVIAIAVRLGDEPRLAPEEVDYIGPDSDVYLGLGDPVLSAKAQKGPLQVAAGGLGAVAEVAQGAGVGGDRDQPAPGGL
jgi:hypothetical protein